MEYTMLIGKKFVRFYVDSLLQRQIIFWLISVSYSIDWDIEAHCIIVKHIGWSIQLHYLKKMPYQWPLSLFFFY